MGGMIQIDPSIIEPNLFHTVASMANLFPEGLPLFFAGAMIVTYINTKNAFLTGSLGIGFWFMYYLLVGVPDFSSALSVTILTINGMTIFFMMTKVIRTMISDRTYE